MWCCNSMHAVCDYASGATYRECPNIEQIRSGVIPLDSLPAAWWNWMWWDTNKAVNEARDAVGMFLNEMNTVLAAAGVTANCTCVDNLYCAIEKIRTTIGNSMTAGAVKSSSCCGEVSIDSNGIMTANGVGNAANLNTTAHVIVDAINEVNNAKAPTNHASANTTYGVGNADCYGHLKISDTYDTLVGGASAGIAASQQALYCVYNAIASSQIGLSDTAACALGTAAAGTASTAARSDHVHPLPTCVMQSVTNKPIWFTGNTRNGSPMNLLSIDYCNAGSCVLSVATCCLCVCHAMRAAVAYCISNLAGTSFCRIYFS